MTPVTMLSLATQTPPHAMPQATALAIARDTLAHGFDDFDRMATVFANSGIRQRQLARPADWYRSPHGFAERNAVYLEVAEQLWATAAGHALAQAGLGAGEVDAIVTVSSTGIATPSLEARVAGRMGFRGDVMRVPLFGLGCAGGVSGLGLAARLAAERPGRIVLFVTVELCSVAFRSDDVGKADVIAAALFGDGAAACVLKAGDEGFATIDGAAETLWPDTLDIMGWQVEPHGFGVVLNRAIPSFARRHLRQAMEEMLDRAGLALGDIDRFICHPGGAKVVDAIELALDLPAATLDHERQVLGDHGNMSAPTALFVLDRVRRAGMPPRAALTALGPGFTAAVVTLVSPA